MGRSVTLVDSGAAVARSVCEYLRAQGKNADGSQKGCCHWYVSDSAEGFSQLASLFLGRPVTEPVEQISIEAY